jgi:uncharacterized membrane protein YhhN
MILISYAGMASATTDMAQISLRLFLGVFLAMALDWMALFFFWPRLMPFTKPLVMVLLILWTLSVGMSQGGHLLILLVLAQFFGLLGDIFLLFSRSWFLWGLGAFLLGHLLYLSILGHWLVDRLQHSLGPTEVFFLGLALVAWSAMLVSFFRLFRPLLRDDTRRQGFRLALRLYGAVLAGLAAFCLLPPVVAAPLSWPDLFLPAGGFLFLISDGLLAYDRFLKKIRHGRLLVRISYHGSQVCLALGMLHILN